MLAALLLLFPLLAPAPAEPAPPPSLDWPIFRGDPGQRGLAKGKLPGPLEVLWKHSTEDSFEGAVAVHKGMVYAGCLDEHLYALDLAGGKMKWKYKGGPFK